MKYKIITIILIMLITIPVVCSSAAIIAATVSSQNAVTIQQQRSIQENCIDENFPEYECVTKVRPSPCEEVCYTEKGAIISTVNHNTGVSSFTYKSYKQLEEHREKMRFQNNIMLFPVGAVILSIIFILYIINIRTKQ